MTTQATTIPSIDAAIAARYAGMVVGGQAVRVFVETPDPNKATERVFPSVSIQLLAAIEESDSLDSEDDSEEEVLFNQGALTRTMRRAPIPHRLTYSVDLWSRVRSDGSLGASDSRDFLMLAVVKRTPPKSFLTVTTVDGATTTVWAFREGALVTRDEVDADEVIYHKSFSLEVLAHLDMAETSVVPVTAATVVEVYSKTPEVVGPSSTDSLDIEFEITDTGIEVVFSKG